MSDKSPNITVVPAEPGWCLRFGTEKELHAVVAWSITTSSDKADTVEPITNDNSANKRLSERRESWRVKCAGGRPVVVRDYDDDQ